MFATEKLTFHPISRADFGLLGEWLVTPHVARWWADDPSAAAVEADYGGCVDGTEAAEIFIASLDARPVGLIQRYRLDAYPQYIEELVALMAVPAAAYSIDYFLGPADVLGQGFGSRMICAFTARLWRDDPARPALSFRRTHSTGRHGVRWNAPASPESRAAT